MAHPSSTQYLDTKVRTASQPQLHLMLLDGALRFGRQAKESWEDDTELVQTDAPLARMIDIVEELANGAAAGKEKGSKELEEQYAFAYRELTACRINHDLSKLDDCLKLLEYQRATWKLACDQLASSEVTPKGTMKPPSPHLSVPMAGSLSLEA